MTKNIIVRDYQKFYNGDIKSYKDIKPAQQSKISYHGNGLYYYQLFLRIKEFQDKQSNENISYLLDEKDKTRKNYVLIIDEINRGNISRIFGELITLIEPNKRAGADETISVKLPYSKEDFSVSNNLYIIGTMNTADRSLTMMDTALRRRFNFIEMMPEPKLVDNCDGVNLQKLLTEINKRIEYSYDREHTIGHSFLINVNNLKELRNAFKNKILPLLEEYFYEDFKKICEILNDKNGNFYKKIEPQENLFLDMEVDIQDKEIYRRQNIDKLNITSFKNIYQSTRNEP